MQIQISGWRGAGALRTGRRLPSGLWLFIGLIGYGLLWLGPLKGFSLISPLQPLWHAAVLGLGLLLMGQVLARAVPVGLAPVKYLLGVGIFLSLLVYVLGLLFLPAAQQAGVQADAGRGVSYTAMRRGGLGSIWTVLVERRTYALLVVRERTLAQYDREEVLRIDVSAPGRVRVHLHEPGKPDRIDDLLPG